MSEPILIDNWSLVYSVGSPYTPPEYHEKKLRGVVYNHPNFAWGDSVTTSSIVKIEGGIVFTKSGSEYKLGKIDPRYEARYPKAVDLIA